MGKIKGWKKVSEETQEVRRPVGIRMVTTKKYRSNKKGVFLTLVTAPRRPKYSSFGRVSVGGHEQFEGTEQEAKDFAARYMEEHSTW